MFKCHVCGSENSDIEHVNEVFNINGKLRLVENIPATVCSRCGEAIFDGDTTERIRVMLQGEKRPMKSISLDVFSYDEAV